MSASAVFSALKCLVLSLVHRPTETVKMRCLNVTVVLNKTAFADTKRFRMVIELRLNHTSELIYSSAFHNAFRLQVSFTAVAFHFIQYLQVNYCNDN